MQSLLNSVRRARPLLGTLVEINATASSSELSAAFDAAFAAIEQVQRLMSFHDEDSDVSRINAADAGCDVCIDAQTYHVLQRATELGDLSDGFFDIATADVLVLRGFLPAQNHPKMPLSGATYRDLELGEGNRVQWRRKGWIDLGGIAKGYAVDCAIASLQSHGIASGMVNAGGDLRCFGEAQPIHARRPDEPTSLVSLGYLQDGAIATSAGYFSAVSTEVGSVNPLVDPKQKICTAWDYSVSVVASDCMTADALTKIVRLSRESAPDILAMLNAQAVVINGNSVGTCGAMLLQELTAT